MGNDLNFGSEAVWEPYLDSDYPWLLLDSGLRRRRAKFYDIHCFKDLFDIFRLFFLFFDKAKIRL